MNVIPLPVPANDPAESYRYPVGDGIPPTAEQWAALGIDATRTYALAGLRPLESEDDRLLASWRWRSEQLSRAGMAKRSGMDSEYLNPILKRLRRSGYVRLVPDSSPQVFEIVV